MPPVFAGLVCLRPLPPPLDPLLSRISERGTQVYHLEFVLGKPPWGLPPVRKAFGTPCLETLEDEGKSECP